MTRLIFPIEAFDLGKTTRYQSSPYQDVNVKFFFKDSILEEAGASLPVPYLESRYNSIHIGAQLKDHSRHSDKLLALARKELCESYLGKEYQDAADIVKLVRSVDPAIIAEKLHQADTMAVSSEEIIINQGIEVDDSLLGQYQQIIAFVDKS